MSRFTIIHLLHAIVHGAWILAASVCSAGWTGVAVYVGDPQSAWNGTSDCVPCNRLCADMAKAARGTRWRVGIGKVRADGTPNHFAVLRALPDEPTPYCEAIRDGRSVAIVEGYTGDIAAINALYPGPTVPSVKRATTAVITSPPVVVRSYVASPPVVVSNSYLPHWTWPGGLRSHLAASHGYSLSWLATLSDDDVERLHDRDHDSGRVTPWGQQRWRPAFAAPRVYAAAPSYASKSRGVSVLGVPIYRSYSTAGRNCPGGICP